MEQLTSGALALAMIAAFLLTAAGVKLALERTTRTRGVLMVIAAVVLIGNVLMISL
ncbi:MAG: hypothetical protein ABIW16_05515 [Sphingomicrobium sp.]